MFNSPIFPREDYPEGWPELIEAAQKTADKEERRALFRTYAEQALERCINLPLSWRVVFFAMQPYVKGLDWSVEDQTMMGNVWLDK